ncbi:MAG: efflux RND transporter periplasmic adaptor subunit [Nitrospira sp.]|nr:efflux RND transporter periplasmic adaptor subunit [Nitrospira sp.]
MTSQPTVEQPEPRKAGVHDADLDGLAIHRPEQTVRSRSPRSRWWLWGVLPALISSGLFAAWKGGLIGPHFTVAVTPVVHLPAGESSGLAATGYVVAQRQALIASKGTGRLEYLGVKVGDRVQAGQVIARLEHADIEALLQQTVAKRNVARARLGEAKPELQEATLNFERVKVLLEKSFVTQSEYDMAAARIQRAAAAVKSAEAAIASAEAERQATQVQLENTNIRAPFDGIVVKKLAEVGEVVSPMTATVRSGGSVVTIVDPASVVVDAEVSEAMIHRVQTGQSADIQLDSVPGHRYQGEVLQVMPTADRAKATVLTRVRFLDLDDRIKPELSAKVMFGPKPGSAEAMTDAWGVPSTAVVTREGHQVVFLVRNGVVQEMSVEVGSDNGPLKAVRGSLSQTDEVVITPPNDLRSGDAVTPVRRAS